MAQDQVKQEQVKETPSVSSKQKNEVDLIIKNSIWKSDEIIQEGTLVILFENFNSITYCYVKRNQTFENRHGLFAHNDMIGKPFGTKIVSRKSRKGYMFLLAPTPELWSRALRHRTQIVFTLDASAIIFNTNLKPGALVIESGTGSGSLTTSLARTVAPHGHVYTFEFNKTRAEIAKAEFARNGLSSYVTVDCRDACEDGFPEELAGTIDMVFYDLPCPWKAIPHASKMLKRGGEFASYSPCIEQVMKTCDSLREHGFELIKTIETRLIPYSARNIDLPVPDFGNKSEQNEQSAPFSSEKQEDDDLLGKKRKRFVGDHVVAKKDSEIRGHTAFLTFATKFFT